MHKSSKNLLMGSSKQLLKGCHVVKKNVIMWRKILRKWTTFVAFWILWVVAVLIDYCKTIFIVIIFQTTDNQYNRFIKNYKNINRKFMEKKW